MNNFTKEELNTLFHWGIDRVETIGTECFEEEGGYKLYDKLRIMIEDYSKCNHKIIVTAYPRSNPPMKCDKCGVLYRE